LWCKHGNYHLAVTFARQHIQTKVDIIGGAGETLVSCFCEPVKIRIPNLVEIKRNQWLAGGFAGCCLALRSWSMSQFCLDSRQN
jgi:hypothetical protein